jgi:uncharacterized membrane protein
VSLRRLLQGVFVLSLLGLGISLYLTYVYTSNTVAVCLSGGGCDTVQHSPYARILGVPIPTLGAVAYGLLLVLAACAQRKSERQETWLLALFGVSFVGLLFSGYLTYLEKFVIHAWCTWCVASAIIQVAVFALTLAAWRRYQQEG